MATIRSRSPTERSASAATLEYDGQQVNHQWSKSLAFEALLGDWLHTHVASDLDYCSLLRPYWSWPSPARSRS
ncbi:UDP-N-acetyl-alpha-D-muramoyl-L-alanyl-L-glutamate epimerase [Rhodanobacter lindaniclasticus]